MKRFVLLALLLCSSAHAEMELVEETDSMSVYSDGQQTIYLIDGIYRADLKAVWQALSQERVMRIMFRHQLIPGRDMIQTYFARSRVVDGSPRCEKFAFRKSAAATPEQLLQIVAFGPCYQQF